tara:strand:- start:651 stop:1445 length:795 start_codon:yes stop_codon:yes gene_type:complete
MILYFAGAEAYPEMLIENKATNWLIAYPSKKIAMYRKDANIFIDSGAFSVYTGKKKVDHNKYISFIKESEMENYASLDVIGDPKQTKKNYLRELKQRLNPIPTYHQGEKSDYLKYYLDHCGTISLGGMVGIGTNKLLPFVENCFTLIAKRNPDIKVHAFGVLSYAVLSRYPFYSADGTSWFAGSKRGNLLPFGSEWIKTSQVNVGTKKARDLYGANILKYCHNDKSDQERTLRGKIRNEYNIRKYLELEQFLTNLWTKRGVAFA